MNAAKTVGVAGVAPRLDGGAGRQRRVRPGGPVLAARARRRQAAGRDVQARGRPRPAALGARPHRAGAGADLARFDEGPRPPARSQAPCCATTIRPSSIIRIDRRDQLYDPQPRARRAVADARQDRLLPGRDARGHRRREDEELPAAAPVPAHRRSASIRPTRRPSCSRRCARRATTRIAARHTWTAA